MIKKQNRWPLYLSLILALVVSEFVLPDTMTAGSGIARMFVIAVFALLFIILIGAIRLVVKRMTK
ncbi:MAG: hypothetical protein PHI93_11925 [Kiritimatiellae bacterium]|nr:hypothetical protein [Kiritimatiellia bacterium]